jgi:adenylate kinase family enzyme
MGRTRRDDELEAMISMTTQPRRWLLLGAGGAGKTTFASELSVALGLPVIHLDRHYWKHGWVEHTQAEWDRTVSELAGGEQWIMDGNYSRTLQLRIPRAEAAILLDPSVIQCLWGVIRRSLFGRGLRPDLAEGCDEQMPGMRFLYWVATYKWRSRPKVVRMLRDAPHVRVFHLRSRKEAATFVDEWVRGRGMPGTL